LQGEVLVLFTVLHDGNLGSVAVKNSSGIAVLDEAALNIIEASAPFPAPTTYGLGLRTYVLPLLFQLK
jgi:protein TonB